MLQEKLKACPVCNAKNFNAFIKTGTLMQNSDFHFYFDKCANCSSVFLNPRVNPKELHQFYTTDYLPYRGPEIWGKYASFVEKSNVALNQKRFNLVKKYAPKKAQLKILDVGCGKPDFLVYCANKTNWSLKGIDFSDFGWRDISIPKNVELKVSELLSYNPNEKYDVITMWHYLEHDYHINETFEKLKSLLNPKGIIVAEVPDYNSLTQTLQKEYWQGWHSPRHTVLFHQKAFKKLAEKHQLKLKKILRYGSLDAFTLWWMGTLEKRKFNWATKSYENEFWPLVFKKILTFPLFLFEKIIPLGIQTVIFEDKSKN
jgi:cyclopropane fatty-acyl-phospholipid synthase-like methyltransferase